MLRPGSRAMKAADVMLTKVINVGDKLIIRPADAGH
jgi:hypothetical protein